MVSTLTKDHTKRKSLPRRNLVGYPELSAKKYFTIYMALKILYGNKCVSESQNITFTEKFRESRFSEKPKIPFPGNPGSNSGNPVSREYCFPKHSGIPFFRKFQENPVSRWILGFPENPEISCYSNLQIREPSFVKFWNWHTYLITFSLLISSVIVLIF